MKRIQHWSMSQVEDIKFEIRVELEKVEKNQGTAQRLAHIQKKMSSFVDDDSSLSRLKRYVLAMSALVHYVHHGGLNRLEVGKIFDLARALLQAEQVKHKGNQLSQLWSDLYLIKSQVDRKWGHAWDAAWNQQMGNHWSQKKDLEFQVLKNLGMGNRALRLGHTRLAYEYFMAGLENKLDIHMWGRARIGVIYCLIYLREKAAALEMIDQTLDEKLLPKEYQLELQWIHNIHLVPKEEGIKSILPRIQKGQDFFASTYIIEAVLWGLGLRSQEYISRLPRLESLSRNKHLKPRNHGEWYQVGIALQLGYDYQIPLQVRMNGISTAISQRNFLSTIDKELLLLAAATRWLARIKAPKLAKLLWAEYSELSFKVSDHQTPDILGILGDIKDRTWNSVLSCAPILSDDIFSAKSR